MTNELATPAVERYIHLETAELLLVNLAQRFDLLGDLDEDDIHLEGSPALYGELFGGIPDIDPGYELVSGRTAIAVGRALALMATDEAREYFVTRSAELLEIADVHLQRVPVASRDD